MKLTTYDGITNTLQEIELTGQDEKILNDQIAELAKERTERNHLRSSNAAAKAALLDRLGITADEAALLLS